MYIPHPYFKNIPRFGNLELDYIFVENGYPILFTCKNNDSLFLCLCTDNAQKQKWFISPTTIDTITDLLHDRITVYSALKENNNYGCIATWECGDENESYEILLCSQYDDSELPSKDFLLEDDGDSSDYLQILNNRENVKSSKLLLLFQDQEAKSFTTVCTSQTFVYKYDNSFEVEFGSESKCGKYGSIAVEEQQGISFQTELIDMSKFDTVEETGFQGANNQVFSKIPQQCDISGAA